MRNNYLQDVFFVCPSSPDKSYDIDSDDWHDCGKHCCVLAQIFELGKYGGEVDGIGRHNEPPTKRGQMSAEAHCSLNVRNTGHLEKPNTFMNSVELTKIII